MNTEQQKTTAKKAVNLRISQNLIKQARALNINLSQTLEQAVILQLRDKQQALWLEENTAAIDAYNKHIEQQGVFSNGLRRF